jgi:DNA-binding CsgD family transcriptional regulator
LNDPLPESAPFLAGPPVAHPRAFFGRERELKRLFHLLRQPPLQNAAIVGPRRSGKTSLLHYLRSITLTPPGQLRPAQRADWLPHAEQYRWAFVDFQDPRLSTREALLRFLLAQWRLPAPGRGDLESFMDVAARELRTPTVVLFDEIGIALARYRELDNAFWEGMRSLATNQVGGNLAFVLAAQESPSQLAGQHSLGSPFFNIFGYTAALGPLSGAEARELIARAPVPFPDADAEWILTQSACWPLPLQILCRERLLTLAEGERGENWRHDALVQVAHLRSTTAAALSILSERETEVLRLLASGLSNQDIAAQLVIAVSTVKTHVNNIYAKLRVETRTQAVARARQLQLI